MPRASTAIHFSTFHRFSPFDVAAIELPETQIYKGPTFVPQIYVGLLAKSEFYRSIMLR